MSDTIVTVRPGYDQLLLAAQQVVNAGADPAQVQDFIQQLTPLYQQAPLPLEPQPALAMMGGMNALGVEKPRIELPPASEFSWWQDALIGVAVLAIPIIGLLVNLSRPIAAVSGVTIGIGPQVNVGAGVGVSLGVGLCVTPNGKLGAYGSVGGLVGALASISGMVQITIIKGGIDKFGGACWGAGISGGEVVVGNAAALLSMTSPVVFMGITAGVGVGYGIPLEVFITAQNTWTT